MQQDVCCTYSLAAPVTAIAVGAQLLCLAIGNRVLATDVSYTVNSGMFLVAELPNGAVITALEVHILEDETTVILIGTGGRVYVLPVYSEHSCVDISPRLVADFTERVLTICSLRSGFGVLVLTALNSAFVLSGKHLVAAYASSTEEKTTQPLSSVMKYAVDGLGVALAADAVQEAGNRGLAVFTGTYAGSISAWRVPVAVRDQPHHCIKGRNQQDNGHQLRVLSTIKAHRPGCAVFAVKVSTISSMDAKDGKHLSVATCSDDRSASLHVATDTTCTLSEGMIWVCCWRGYGPTFSRRRVFDVSVLRVPGDDFSLFLATGGEDGSVHAFSFSTKELAATAATAATITSETENEAKRSLVTPELLFYRLQQHDGRGVYKVALLLHHHTATGATFALVSCGFDGSANLTLLPSSNMRKSVVVSSEMERKQQKHVRGVVSDERGTFLACTEDELIILSKDAGKGNQLLPLPTSREAKDLPSCISTIISSTQLYSLALLGTTGGNVYGVWYDENISVKQDETRSIAFPLLSASSSSSSKVLFVRAIWWEDRLLLTSTHANGRLIVSVLSQFGELSEVWMTGYCTGVHTTSLSMCLVDHKEGLKLCIFIGDDEGKLSVELLDLCGEKKVSSLMHRVPFFQKPVASVYRTEMVEQKGRHERITAVSLQGEWRVFLLDVDACCVDIPPVSCPLRLPWRSSYILACNDTVAVTQFGTDITVSVRLPSHSSWQPVAQYHGVKAPRLLSATISPKTGAALPVYVCHCSDGAQVECHTCSEENRTYVLHGGTVVGREYNAVLFLPAPVCSFVCGSENSMLTIIPTASSLTSGMEGPLSFSGPHDSNILAMTLCNKSRNTSGDSVWFVTAGGLATLALWEWSAQYSWRIVAHISVEQQQQRGWRRKREEKNNGEYITVEEANSRAVPRFLSVCVTLEEIVVGGSDGRLKVFSLTEKLELLCEMQLSASMPKPVTAVATLSAEDRLVVAGDTNGFVSVCNVGMGLVSSHHSWTRASVNALGVGRRLHDSPDTWRVLAAMDSGDVVLLHVGVAAVEVICSVCVGFTAGRGVSWLPERHQLVRNEKGKDGEESVGDVEAVIVNDERLTFLRVCDAPTPLCVVGHRRVNVRGISGVAVSSTLMCMVVGQGVEAVQLCPIKDGGERGNNIVGTVTQD